MTPRRERARRTATALPALRGALLLWCAALPLAGAAEEDIRDIRGPKFVLPWWALPAALATLVLVTALGYAVWRWRRRRRAPRVLLPFEIALARLEGIRPLMQPVHAREFSTAASDIVRSYIEQRFEVTATQRTTEEFLHDLLDAAHAALFKHRALLAEFLQQCDLVKFAGISLTGANMEALHASARAFVLETAKPEPVVSGTAAAGGPVTPSAPGPARVEAHDTLPST